MPEFECSKVLLPEGSTEPDTVFDAVSLLLRDTDFVNEADPVHEAEVASVGVKVAEVEVDEENDAVSGAVRDAESDLESEFDSVTVSELDALCVFEDDIEAERLRLPVFDSDLDVDTVHCVDSELEVELDSVALVDSDAVKERVSEVATVTLPLEEASKVVLRLDDCDAVTEPSVVALPLMDHVFEAVPDSEIVSEGDRDVDVEAVTAIECEWVGVSLPDDVGVSEVVSEGGIDRETDQETSLDKVTESDRVVDDVANAVGDKLFDAVGVRD